MTQEDIIDLMRSGALRLVIRYSLFQGENQPGITMSGNSAVFTPGFLEAFQQCQAKLFVRLKRSDVRVCLAPDEHRSSYCFRSDTLGKVFMCPLCAAMREEQANALPPVENCVQFENMRPIGHDNLV